MSQEKSYTKIHIPPKTAHDFGETVWALPIAHSLYQIANIPMVVYGYAEGDIVRCESIAGTLQVVELYEDGGNGTIRLQFTDSSSTSTDFVLNELVSIGCTYEKFHHNIVGVTIRPITAVPFVQISDFLNNTPDNVLTGWEVGKWLSHS